MIISAQSKEHVAKWLGYSVILVVAVAFYSFKFGGEFQGTLILALWCFCTGFWALTTGYIFWPGGKKAPKALLYGKIPRFLGAILLLISMQFLYLFLSQ